MQIIHQGSFTVERAQGYRSVLLTNILIGLKDIGSKTKDLESGDLYKKSRWIQDLDESLVEWDDDLVDTTKRLWNDTGYQNTWKEIKDNVIIQMEYLMENIDRFVQPDFVPSNEDILRARHRTTGESISTFEDAKHIWNLIDVGGQFSERQKWEDFFNEHRPHAIIFFLAIDEYNVPNTELKTDYLKTKFELSLDVFRKNMCGGGPVADHKLCRIVFLNKVDIFEEKIKDDRKFAEFKEALGYDGGRTVKECTDFILKKLVAINDQEELRVHVTNALDTEMMKKVTNDIKSSIITGTLKDLGMI